MKFWFVCPLVFVWSCTSPNRESGLSFNHHKGTPVFGTILGQERAQEKNLLKGQKVLRICITNQSNLDDEVIYLETQLAYSFWLRQAHGDLRPLDNKYTFVLNKECAANKDRYNSVLVFAGSDAGSTVVIGDKSLSFKKPKLFCRKIVSKSIKGQTTTTQCSSHFVAGIASAANTLISRTLTTNKIVKIQLSTPAALAMSPYMKWISIVDSTFRNDENKIIYGEIKKEYERLQNLEDRKISDFVTLQKLLTDNKVVLEANGPDKKLIAEFRDSEVNESEIDYTPESNLFVSLLHEVGHQFGLLHADQPELGAENGQSISAVLNEQDRWVSKVAVMAYGEPYLYLEEDDIRGIQSVQKEIDLMFAQEETASSK